MSIPPAAEVSAQAHRRPYPSCLGRFLRSLGASLCIVPAVAPEPQDRADAVVYANWVRVESTPFDIAIDLGYRSDPSPPVRFPVRVITTWEHAAVLRDLLDSAISEYEEEIGALRDFQGEIGPAATPEDADDPEEESP